MNVKFTPDLDQALLSLIRLHAQHYPHVDAQIAKARARLTRYAIRRMNENVKFTPDLDQALLSLLRLYTQCYPHVDATIAEARVCLKRHSVRRINETRESEGAR